MLSVLSVGDYYSFFSSSESVLSDILSWDGISTNSVSGLSFYSLFYVLY